MVEKEDRPGENTEATNHNTHSHGPEADTLEGTSAEALADHVDDFRRSGEQAKPRGATAGGENP